MKDVYNEVDNITSHACDLYFKSLMTTGAWYDPCYRIVWIQTN